MKDLKKPEYEYSEKNGKICGNSTFYPKTFRLLALTQIVDR